MSSVGRAGGTIARESVVRDRPLILAAEMKEIGRTDGDVEVILGLVTSVEESWLREMFPEDFSEKSGLVFEENGRKVYQVEQKRFRDLVLEEKRGMWRRGRRQRRFWRRRCWRRSVLGLDGMRKRRDCWGAWRS